ncbi:hypothetical protein GCM10010121_059590 [Streptomyces brasiliensis]|uniref:Transposase n=1 Tax=Streptomyces brasiliensis TaxID=1954 RepID=A0A917L1N2_9ACTN|nr:hypothetical protein GCM10010121_059590 [Streptomyces brasiliensis]
MKTWKIQRDCRFRGDGVRHAILGIAHLHDLALTRWGRLPSLAALRDDEGQCPGSGRQQW